MDIALDECGRYCFKKNAVQTDKNRKSHKYLGGLLFLPRHRSGEGGTEKTVAGLVVDDLTSVFCEILSIGVKDWKSTGYRIIFNETIYNILSVDHMNYKRNP